MYSRQEASKIKQDFWTRFGQYLKPVQSATGEKVNWSNYKTGVAHIYFRLRAEKGFASVAIEITTPDEQNRIETYRLFLSMRPMVEHALGAPPDWIEHTTDEFGKPLSRISITLPAVNIFRESDWPAIISFFKRAITGLDEFWSDAKTMFD